MQLLVPLGVVLTLLTNNRHVFGIVATAHVLVSALRVVLSPTVTVGAGGAMFAVVAAVLIRSIGFVMRNRSKEAIQLAIAGVFGPAIIVFLFVAVLDEASRTAHFIHFFGFLFGGTVETAFVLFGHDAAINTRHVPDRLVG